MRTARSKGRSLPLAVCVVGHGLEVVRACQPTIPPGWHALPNAAVADKPAAATLLLVDALQRYDLSPPPHFLDAYPPSVELDSSVQDLSGDDHPPFVELLDYLRPVPTFRRYFDPVLHDTIGH